MLMLNLLFSIMAQNSWTPEILLFQPTWQLGLQPCQHAPCISTLSPQLVALLGKVVELVEGGALVMEEGHSRWGLGEGADLISSQQIHCYQQPPPPPSVQACAFCSRHCGFPVCCQVFSTVAQQSNAFVKSVYRNQKARLATPLHYHGICPVSLGQAVTTSHPTGKNSAPESYTIS